MSKHFAIGMAVAALCLVLAGCGGGSDGVSQSAHSQLQAELDVLKAQQAEEAEEAKTETAAEETADKKREKQIADLAAAIAALTTALAEEETTTTDTTTETDDEEEEEEDEEEVVVTPTPTPTPTPAPTRSSGEDVRRAHNILAAFDSDDGDEGVDFADVAFTTLTFGLTTNDPDITVEKGSIKVRSNLFKSKGSVASLTGFTGFSLQNEAPATVGVDEEIWHIHTNIEKTRGELEHYYNNRRAVNKPGQFVFDATDLTPTYTPPTTGTTTSKALDTFTMSGIGAMDADGHRRVTLKADADNENTVADDENTVTITRPPGGSFSARVRGNSVTATCESVADCTFTINLEDKPDPDTTTNKPGKYLAGTPFAFTPGQAATGQGGWVFKASSQKKIAIPGGGDREFAYFGWWMQIPDSADGSYQFEPRVGGMGLQDYASALFPGDAKYRYVGKATGWYVEEDRSKTVESDGDFLTDASSGIFTATASLETTSTGVTGAIKDFKEGGTSLGNWEVDLRSGNATALTVGDTTGGEGNWGVQFVPSRVGGANPQATGTTEAPVAAVGYFNASLDEVLHLSGAFGAER